MEYLANPFNHSINSLSNDGICGVLNMASLNLFYYIIFLIGSKLVEIQILEDVLEGNDDIKEISDMVFDNVFEDETVDKQVKKDLISLLDINSLERHYILYYIFKKRGSFYDGDSDINTYAYYKTVVNDWRNIYFADDNLTFIMNLNDSLENDYQIVIDNLICDCNMAHVRFLSWLHYSGIYGYLVDRQDIKKTVLNDMNTKTLLKGNLFLKYQLYLIAMENNENNENKENKDILVEECITEDTEEECIKKEGNILTTIEEENQEERQNILTNMDTMDLAEESTDDNEEANYSENDYTIENEDELNERSITEDFSNMNEITFAGKLFTTVRNITIRTLISTWKIIKEEAAELFHPVLD
jgi:hypothetical protein